MSESLSELHAQASSEREAARGLATITLGTAIGEALLFNEGDNGLIIGVARIVFGVLIVASGGSALKASLEAIQTGQRIAAREAIEEAAQVTEAS